MSELPEAFRLDMEVDVSDPLASSPSTSPFLMAQQCELVVAANRAVLRLYMPFMKNSGSSGGSRPSHQALMGTINAAHAIIHASRVLHTLWKDTRPTASDFYDYSRSIFDAAVVCAYVVMQQPKNILAVEAVKGLSGALEVMRALERSKNGGSENSGVPSEALRIVELMKEKAERARASDAPTSAGVKRKRTDPPTSESTLSGGFQLPYVGPSVSSAKPEQPRVAPLSSKIAAVAGAKRDSTSNPHEPKAPKTSSSSEKKTKEKSSKYPTIGIRIRTPQNSATPPSTTSATSGAHRAIAPVKTSVQSPVSPPDRSQQSSTLSSHSGVPYTYPQTHPTPAPPPPQQEPPSAGPMMHEFQMEFTANPATTDHYGHSYTSDSSPGSSTGYDHPPPTPSGPPFDNNGSQAQPSFHPGPPHPPPQDYYMATPSYTPGPSGYEHQPQNMAMSTPYGMTGSLDSAMSTGVPSIPSTPRDSYMMLSDKSAPGQFGSRVAKSELDCQMNAEYHPTATSHSHGMTMASPYVQGWRPENSWEYDKYYNHHS